jgi:hypothetical protein
VDWPAIDWSKNNSEIAAELGIGINNVLKYRAKLGQKNPFTPQAARPHRTVTKEMIESANWLEDRDVDICQKWGVTRERVRQIRIENKKPECIYQGRYGLPLLKAINANRAELIGLDLVDIAAKLTPVVGTIKRSSLVSALKFLGVEFKTKRLRYSNMKYPRDEMNWDLPNIVLAKIYGCSTSCIANARSRDCKPHPKWRLGGFFKGFLTVDFTDALVREINLAKTHGFDFKEDVHGYMKSARDRLDALTANRYPAKTEATHE